MESLAHHPTAFTEFLCGASNGLRGALFVGHKAVDADSIAAAVAGAELYNGVACRADGGTVSLSLDCHSGAPPSTFGRCYNRDQTGGAIRRTVSPTARHRPVARHRRAGGQRRDRVHVQVLGLGKPARTAGHRCRRAAACSCIPYG